MVAEVVLLNLKLPKVEDLEFLGRIREEEGIKLLTVVIFTSSSEVRDIKKRYNLGANNYIQKSVYFDQFIEHVKHIGLYWLVLNIPPL